VPTLGDLNNDNLPDLLLGLDNGQLLYFENSGTMNAPNFSVFTANYQGIDVGQNASPQLVDVNRDGLLDLLVGERNGNTNYFENTGTTTSATFSATPTNAFLGGIDTKIPGTLSGNAAPHLVDIGGRYRLFMGNDAGQIWQYDNIDGNLSGVFNRINGSLDSIDVGAESHVVVGHSSSATSLVFLIGNKRGGLQVYSTQEILSQKRLKVVDNSLILVPNPTQDLVQIILQKPLTKNSQLALYNTLGQLVMAQQWPANEQQQQLSIQHLPAGTYLLQIATHKKMYVQLVHKL
jgi:hypothetical protein